MSAHQRKTEPRSVLSSRAAFDQVASDEGELDRHAQTLRACLRRLNAAVLMV